MLKILCTIHLTKVNNHSSIKILCMLRWLKLLNHSIMKNWQKCIIQTKGKGCRRSVLPSWYFPFLHFCLYDHVSNQWRLNRKLQHDNCNVASAESLRKLTTAQTKKPLHVAPNRERFYRGRECRFAGNILKKTEFSLCRCCLKNISHFLLLFLYPTCISQGGTEAL